MELINAGLILEGGGMRGIFTAGVLDFFMEKKIYFSQAVGVSAGACHACSYKSLQQGRAFAMGTEYLGDKRYCSVYSLITTGDMFGAEFAYHELPEKLNPVDAETFRLNPMKFFAVVTNCATGEAEYMPITEFSEDVEKVRASSSLPLISRNVPIGNAEYLDGGIADSIPIEFSERCGFVRNAVILTRQRGYRKKQDPLLPLLKMKYAAYPDLVRSMASRFEVYNRELELVYERESAGLAVVIQPPKPLDIGRTEKNPAKLRAAYEIGRKAAANKYREIITLSGRH